MFAAGTKVLLLLLAAGSFLSESGSVFLVAKAVSLVPTDGGAFDRETNMPPVESGADLVFNWHDDEMSGDNNTIATTVYMMSDGGNTTVSDSSVPGYVIDAVAVQFNSSPFSSKALDFPWLAVFPCTKNSKAGNSSALVSNAERLGAVAILVRIPKAPLTPGATSRTTIQQRRSPSTRPSIGRKGRLSFPTSWAGYSHQAPSPSTTPAALSALSTNISADFSALNSESLVPVLTNSPVLLARIPAIGANVTAAAAQASAYAEKWGDRLTACIGTTWCRGCDFRHD
ncbi:hypothetical protein C8F01DRAFT_1150542, partial [Mycena amicta]